MDQGNLLKSLRNSRMMNRGTLLEILRQESIELFYVKYSHLPDKKAREEYSEARKIGNIVFPEAVEYSNFVIPKLKNEDIKELIRLLENQIVEKLKYSMFPIKRFKWKDYYEK